jgi:nucleotide-binding universal stress UspA family protein
MDCAKFCPAGKVEKLLLATDRSEYSEGAEREAINFSKKCKSKLYAMTVIEMYTEQESLGENIYELEEKRAKEHMDKVKAMAQAEGVDCEVIIHYGEDPHALILDEARQKQADLIVIGRRGTKGLAKLLLGEVAARVIGHAPCDVLVVPRAARIQYEHLLVATDGSVHSEEAAKKAVEIATRCGGSIIAMSAIRTESELKEAEANVARVAEAAKKAGVSVETLTPKGRSYDMIVETAGGRGVDLVVMGTYGKTGLGKIMMGSSTEKVIGRAGCGILVVGGGRA